MVEEIGKGTKAEPVEAQAEMTLQQRLMAERWPISDDFAKAVIVERPEKDVLTLGFVGYADNKKIALSTSLEKWKAIFTDGLALIRSMEAEAGKPKT